MPPTIRHFHSHVSARAVWVKIINAHDNLNCVRRHMEGKFDRKWYNLGKNGNC